MSYYNYKELRDALPPEMVDKWAEEDGTADYDSTLWSYGAEYIDQLKKERDEMKEALEYILGIGLTVKTTERAERALKQLHHIKQIEATFPMNSWVNQAKLDL